ncbi:hypothetical protein [Neobacillus niacini]|uniref:hypothetical protein n=1 Tax=Neobacillus niacini TaxID=86668 RepID=UPI0021CB0A8C|nr:hypothetical protein [Neobacillus niacini]MCM3766624.1 hypothetical protein [Neobacillus niacini]
MKVVVAVLLYYSVNIVSLHYENISNYRSSKNWKGDMITFQAVFEPQYEFYCLPNCHILCMALFCYIKGGIVHNNISPFPPPLSKNNKSFVLSYFLYF